MTANISLVLKKVNEIDFETHEAPVISEDNDVIVEVKKTGICGSDIHYYTHGRIGDFVLKKPMVLGHESSGVVAQVGKGVTSLKVGDRVAIEPGVPSRYSEEYKSGHYNLCPHMVFAATPNSDENGVNPPGTLCKYFKSPEDFLVKLPDHVSLELAALVEPMSVAVHAARLTRLSFGDTVVVYGAGPVGLLAASVALKFGASRVAVVDIVDSKLEMAKKVGVATHTFNSTSGGIDELIAAIGNERPNVVMECTGAEKCIQSAIEVLKVGGRYVQIGNSSKPVSFNMTAVVNKELTVFGSFRYGFNDYKTSVAILDNNYRSGKEKAAVDFESLITHRFKFKDAIKAYDLVKGGNGCIKCVIDGPE